MQKQITFPNGSTVPKLGQGTWKMGEVSSKEKDEIQALQTGVKKGLTLLDTAEMYGSGNSEIVLGEAIRDFNREDLFIVSKVLPSRAGEKEMFQAVDESLMRLGINELDLYLLHWRGGIPLQETIDVFEELIKQGKIKGWGVSNFDIDDMKELMSLRDGEKVQTNQVMYHLASRGIEYSMTDYLKNNNVPIMAYCPLIGQDPAIKEEVFENRVVNKLAKKYNITITQLLLAWVLNQENIIPIPKAGKAEHVLQNAEVLDIELAESDLEALDKEYPAPDHKTPLEIR